MSTTVKGPPGPRPTTAAPAAKKAAPPPPPAPGPDAKPASWGPKTKAAAAPKPVAPKAAPVTEETQRDLGDAKQRAYLATQTSQVNEVSMGAENEQDIC